MVVDHDQFPIAAGGTRMLPDVNLPLCGSTLANGISTSGFASAAASTSSLPIRLRPMPASSSTVKITAAMLRSR